MFKVDLGNRLINCNKWKGKNKKEFVKALKCENLNEMQVMDSLVYSCIEEDVILSIDEFKYVLSRIRAHSLGEDIEIEFYCENCAEIFKKQFKLKDIVKYTYNDLKEIKVGNVHIKLGEIRNKQAYITKVSEDEDYDIFFRIESFNGDDSFTLDGLIDKFDDLDIDVLSKIMEIWENSKFKIDDIVEVECPECTHKTKYRFDEIPGFFPESWFE